MGFISITERLKLLTRLSHTKEHAHIQQYLALYEHVNRAYACFFTAHPTAITDWMTQLSTTSLEAKARDAKDSLIRFLDAQSFKSNMLLALQDTILTHAITDPTQKTCYANYQSHTRNCYADLTQLVTAVLQANNSVIQSYADRFDLDSSFFLFILSSILQPFLEALAKNVSTDFYENWWQSTCPVCGQTPVVARIRKRRRYLMCAYCGAEYLSDHFLCVHCDNRDPYTLQYLHLDEKPAFRIDYCTKCHKYLKIINDDKLKETIPRFLEDILTLDLDLYAQRAGLTRDVS